MSRHLLAVLCAGLIGAAVVPLQASAAPTGQPGFSCARTGDSIVVHFGINKRPTNFGVETPGGRFLYIVVPAKGIDHLGGAYKRDTLMLGLEDTRGSRLGNDDRNEDEKVFGVPGQYTLHFQDANRAEYEDLYALSCTIEIPPRLAAIGNPNGRAA